MKKLVWLLLLTVVLSACGSDTTSPSSSSAVKSLYQELSVHRSAVKSAATTPTEAQKMAVTKLFLAMFNATPGADLLNLCANFLAGGMTESELANLLAGLDLFKSASFYPESLSNLDFSLKYLNNLVGSTVSEASKTALAAPMAELLNAGWKRGDLMWLLVSAFSNIPSTEPAWGSAAALINNRLSVSYYYSVTKAVSSVDLSIIASVSNDPATVTAAKAGIDSANLAFTTAMISGKSFVYSVAGGNTGVTSHNADGTFISTKTGNSSLSNGTWSINSSGQLIGNNQSRGLITTSTLVSGNATQGWNVSMTDSSGMAYTGTLVPCIMFTTAMISGKSFAYSVDGGNTGVTSHNADGTFISTKTGNSSLSNGTWSINSSGQLIGNNQSRGLITTSTLVSGNATQGWKVSMTDSSGMAYTGTLIPR